MFPVCRDAFSTPKQPNTMNWSPKLEVAKHTVFHARQLLQKSDSLQSVFTISYQQPGEIRVCAKWIRHVFNSDQIAKCVLLATTHLQHWRNEGISSLSHIMADESWMHSFDPQLKWQCWILYLNVTEEENCTAQSVCSKNHVCHILHSKWTCGWPSCTNLYHSDHFYCALL